MTNGFSTWFNGLSAAALSLGARISGGRRATIKDLTDSQLSDIGIHRDEAQNYRRLREPALLEVLFPRKGGASNGGQNDVKALPPHPRHGPTRRREKQDA